MNGGDSEETQGIDGLDDGWDWLENDRYGPHDWFNKAQRHLYAGELEKAAESIVKGAIKSDGTGAYEYAQAINLIHDIIKRIPENVRSLDDRTLPCQTCGPKLHQFRPDPGEGSYWFWYCSGCGEITCVTPDGRTDGHERYATSIAGIGCCCYFCHKPMNERILKKDQAHERDDPH